MIIRFDEFALRPAVAEDLPLATTWTRADPDHWGMDAAFWIQQGYRVESWLLHDATGPVFFFTAKTFENRAGAQLEKVLEVHVQFPPVPNEHEGEAQRQHRQRMGHALLDGTAWLEKNLRGEFAEIRFESLSPGLIRFCERHLGFTNQGGRLFKRLHHPVQAIREA